MQTCSTTRPFSMTTIWCAVLLASNHDGGALVRDAVERRPRQSFALGVARGSRLISSSPGAFFTIARNREALALTESEVTPRLPTDVSILLAAAR